METIFYRRSVRSFKSDLIEEIKIEKLLRAAMQAPSATNQQPWEFVVINDKAIINELVNFSVYATPLKTATLAIVILRKEDVRAPKFTDQDLGACTQNLLLEAAHLGLGAVWMGISCGDEREAFVAKLLNTPNNIKPFSVIALGYPVDDNANHFTDRFDASRIHYNKY